MPAEKPPLYERLGGVYCRRSARKRCHRQRHEAHAGHACSLLPVGTDSATERRRRRLTLSGPFPPLPCAPQGQSLIHIAAPPWRRPSWRGVRGGNLKRVPTTENMPTAPIRVTASRTPGEAIARRDLKWVKRTLSRSLLSTLLVGVPMSTLLVLFGRQIIILPFPSIWHEPFTITSSQRSIGSRARRVPIDKASRCR